MASLKTDLVTNSDSVPPVMNDVGKSGGNVRIQCSHFIWNGTTFNTIGDFVRLCRLPTNARVISLVMWCDDLDAHGTETLEIDFGYYPTNSDIPVDDNCITNNCEHFQSAQQNNGIEFMMDLGDDLPNMGKTIWEVAGLGSNPGGLYDLCMTISTAAATAADGKDVAFRVMYTID